MFRGSNRFLKRTLYGAVVALVLLVAIDKSPWNASKPLAAADIQVSREQFVRYIEEWSEPEGYFDTDNFISNETSYLHVIPELRTVQPGGVYVGVGPDQNFSYIVHTRPALAVIIDIRRQNMLEHLLYKALFDLSASRAEFLAMLFSRETPRVERNAGLSDLLKAVRQTSGSEARYKANLAAINKKLTGDYSLKLGADDLAKIQYVYATFFRENLDLRFSSIGRNNASNYPTFEEMLAETDRSGRQQNYLSTEDLFLQLKKFQAENRLIPIVGDFSGPRAFKTVGAFLGRSGLQVSTFYTSNVEFYIFGGRTWASYMANVRALPMSPDAVFIRAYFSSAGPRHRMNVVGHRSTTLVHDAKKFI